MHKLVKADILAKGSSNFHYRGLGDRIFAMVFRRLYGVEIERVELGAVIDERIPARTRDLAPSRDGSRS